MGRVVGMVPYGGRLTVLMNEKPWVRVVVLGTVVGLAFLSN